jgi:hypothetical protein
MRIPRRWVLPSVMVSLGVLMIVVGSLVRAAYASAIWLELGAALALFGPLYWTQSMLEKGITEVRRQAGQTRSSVEQLSHDVETIRQQTTAGLDDLRRVTLEYMRQRRSTDEDAFRRFEEESTFDNITRLLQRARELGAVSDRGVRVRLPGTTFRLRFPLSVRVDNGNQPVLEVGLEEEDGTLPHDATAPRRPMRGHRPIQWSAAQDAGAWAASVAPELQRLNRYPGDDHFDPAGALQQLTALLRLAVEARTRPESAATVAGRLAPVIEQPNDEWIITEEGLQSLTSDAGFTIKELFSKTASEAAPAQLPDDRAAKLREAWGLAQRLFLTPGSVL